MRSLWFLFFVLCSASVSCAQICAATPEAAAQTALGATNVSSGAGAGFRVQDVQVDPVLRRVWVRVRRCGDVSAPAILVPLQAPVNAVVPMASAAGLQAMPSAPTTLSAQSAVALRPAAVAVHPGDNVRVVFASSSVQMQLEATVNQQGAVGDRVQVTLKRRASQAPDEPEHRMTGTVLADKSVEVKM